MAKYTNIEVIKDLYISESGIQFKTNNSELLTVPGIRFNNANNSWEYNNGNDQWLSIGAGKDDVFYVNEFPSGLPEEIGIYINNSGESKYFNGNEWINISYEIVSTISELSANVLKITSEKSVVDYVYDKLSNISGNFILTGTIFNYTTDLSGQPNLNNYRLKTEKLDYTTDLSGQPNLNNYRLKTEKLDYTTDLSGQPNLSIYLLSSIFANISGDFAMKQDLLNKVEFNINNDLPITNLSSNVLYITPSGEVAVLINDTLTNLSINLVPDMTQYITSNNTGPTCKAVADYVSGAIANIPVTDIQNVFYVDELPSGNNRIKNSLYVLSGTDQSFVTDNNNIEHSISYELVETINSSSTNNTIPGTKAVYDCITSAIANIPVGDTQYIFYVNELPAINNRVSNSIYVLSGNHQSFIIDNNNVEHSISYEITDVITTSSTNNIVPGAKAVYDYVTGAIANIPVGDTQHIFYINSNELPQTTIANSLYILSGNQTVMVDENNIEHNLSYKINNTIHSSSTNETIPGCKAVYDFITYGCSNTFIEIEYGINQENCSWNNNLLTITYDIDTELPIIQIYTTENDSYVPTNIPYTISKTNKSITLNCTGFENKLISIKISK